MREGQGPDTSPTVSIGLPVYNGERFLSRAVDSVVSQEFTDWELLISDNGSSDGTLDLAHTLAASDPRIRVRSFPSNQGAVANFEAVFLETSGPFFMWLAHDDWLDSRYLTVCLDLLDRDPSAVLAFAGMQVVDDAGEAFRDRDEPIDGVESHNPVLRFHRMLWGLRDPTAAVFGVARRSALGRTGLIRNSNEPDRILLGELSVLGPIYQDKRRLFYHYGPPGHTDRDNWAWLNPRNLGQMRWATPRIVGFQARAVWASNHALWQRLGMLVDLLVSSLILRIGGKARAQFARWRKRTLSTP